MKIIDNKFYKLSNEAQKRFLRQMEKTEAAANGRRRKRLHCIAVAVGAVAKTSSIFEIEKNKYFLDYEWTRLHGDNLRVISAGLDDIARANVTALMITLGVTEKTAENYLRDAFRYFWHLLSQVEDELGEEAFIEVDEYGHPIEK